MISALFFIWFLLASLWTINALRRPVPPGQGFPPLWLPGMIISELAPWYLIARAGIAAGFISLGAAQAPIGRAGVALFLLSELGLLVLIGRSIRSARDTGHSPAIASIFKVWERLPRMAEMYPEVHYWNGLTLDVYRRPEVSAGPALIYVHPGSWMRGRPGRQARPMFHQLVLRGWVILDIRYPLSPLATFPDHLVGVKRAIAWAKTEGSKYGVNPNRVVVSGGSSGAHLAALAALTWDRPDLQPGFEEADTSVIGCLPQYGIFDLLIRNSTRYDWPFIARHVLKADPRQAPDLYRLGSPIDQVRADAPPFFIVHGGFDSVVLSDESRQFVRALREVEANVEYREIRGAQHGFDAIASLRTRAVSRMCADWLMRLAGTLDDAAPSTESRDRTE
jgi:acetyl esterase/lipase